MNRIEKDPFQKKLEIRNWFVLGISGLISLFFSRSFAIGLLCGGLISIANYYLLNHSIRKAFLNVSDKTKAFLMVRYYARFAATGIILFLLITQTAISIFGLIAGLSVVVVNIILSTILDVSKKNLIPVPKEVN